MNAMLKKLGLKSCTSNKLDSRTTSVKIIENRIKIADKYIPSLKKAIFNYTERLTKSRDSMNKVCLVLNDYSDEENVSSGLKKRLKDLADVLADVCEIKNVKVKNMEEKVIEQLKDFNKLCHEVRNELKFYKTTTEKERNKLKILTKMKLNSERLEQISLAEEEYSKSKRESAKAFKSLEELIDLFENKKLNSTKAALIEWISTELQFHTRALELYTNAYGIIVEMNVNADIEEFRTVFRLSLSNESTVSERGRSNSVFHLPPTFRRKTKVREPPCLNSKENSRPFDESIE